MIAAAPEEGDCMLTACMLAYLGSFVLLVDGVVLLKSLENKPTTVNETFISKIPNILNFQLVGLEQLYQSEVNNLILFGKNFILGSGNVVTALCECV